MHANQSLTQVHTMRLLAVILLFAAVGCHAQEANGITSRVFELDSDKGGKPDLRMFSPASGMVQ